MACADGFYQRSDPSAAKSFSAALAAGACNGKRLSAGQHESQYPVQLCEYLVLCCRWYAAERVWHVDDRVCSEPPLFPLSERIDGHDYDHHAL